MIPYLTAKHRWTHVWINIIGLGYMTINKNVCVVKLMFPPSPGVAESTDVFI